MDSADSDLISVFGGYYDIAKDLLRCIQAQQKLQTTNHFSFNHNFFLSGPSGCGKTEFAKRFCNYLNAHYKYVSCSSLTDKNIGDSEEYINSLFLFEKKDEFMIFIFDDIDIIIPSEKKWSNNTNLRLLFELLYKLEQIHELQYPWYCFFITNNDIYHYLLCHKYTYQQVYFPNLDLDKRKLFLQVYLQNVNIESTVIDSVAEKTSGYNCSDLYLLCSNTILRANKQQVADYLYTCHDFNEQLSFLSPSQIRHLIPVHPRCGGFDSLPGYSMYTHPLYTSVLYPLQHPEVYTRNHIQPPTGVFISGPSGSGKSALVEALATELKGIANIVTISCTDIISKYLGESEKNLMAIFQYCKLITPCILFLDHVEILGKKRSLDQTDERTFDRLLSSLLTEMDGLYTDSSFLSRLIVIGATSSPELVDSALLRPGRLETHITIEPLSSEQRKEIIMYSIKEIKQYLDPTIVVDDLIQSLVERTDEYRVNDIISIFQRAKYDAFKHCHDNPVIRQENIDGNVFRVSHDHEVSE